jgi:hypothetical protein
MASPLFSNQLAIEFFTLGSEPACCNNPYEVQPSHDDKVFKLKFQQKRRRTQWHVFCKSLIDMAVPGLSTVSHFTWKEIFSNQFARSE